MTFQKLNATKEFDDLWRDCPNCGQHFRADHRNTIFCDMKCRDDFHNAKGKEKRIQREAYYQDLETRFAEITNSKNKQLLLIQNIEILGKLYSENAPCYIHLSKLNEKKFAFHVWSERIVNTSVNNSHCFRYGPFKLELYQDDYFLLSKS